MEQEDGAAEAPLSSALPAHSATHFEVSEVVSTGTGGGGFSASNVLADKRLTNKGTGHPTTLFENLFGEAGSGKAWPSQALPS